jgi:hypothetical protein
MQAEYKPPKKCVPEMEYAHTFSSGVDRVGFAVWLEK